MFLSLAFANKEELGWDMTVNTKLEDGNRLYRFEIDGEYYYTREEDLISKEKAEGIVSSGTRIWRARKGSREYGEEVVIKDYWHGEERQTEDRIHDMICNDVNDPEKREYFRTHTLSPIAWGRVKAFDTEDHTRNTILRGQSPDLSSPFEFPVPPSQGSFRTTVNSKSVKSRNSSETRKQYRQFIAALEKNRRSQYYHRYHYRIVYKEVAVPYYKLRNTRDMYTVLIDVLMSKWSL